MHKPKTPNHSIKQRLENEFIRATLLAIYFAVWFCAIAFLTYSILREDAIPITPFSLALIKAGLCAKFMMIGQAIFPLKIEKERGLIRSLLAHSFVYLFIVLGLSYVETGVDGLIHGKALIASLAQFGNGDPIRIAALAVMYWLIVWPYLLFAGLRQSIGESQIHAILFGSK